MEIELKFALLGEDLPSLVRQLASLPLLARRKPQHVQLHNTYYDTPDEKLRAAGTALRVRRVGGVKTPQWLQTLKIGQGGGSALSQRGEWESAVSGAQLDAEVLGHTPWRTFDPKGAVFAALAPQFTTDFERTRWTVRQRDGTQVEIALDRGTVQADGGAAPIAEIELELLHGPTDALFAMAAQIAQAIPLLPLPWSKSERGYRLARSPSDAPHYAQPPMLSKDMALPALAAAVLQEMFLQFCANLNSLRGADDPEILHQARIGWRRFKSATKLFAKCPGLAAAPSSAALQPLLKALAASRDLEIVASETLPGLAHAYAIGNARRKAQWAAMSDALQQAVTLQRRQVHSALQDPAVGAALIAITRWLEWDLPRSKPDAPMDCHEWLRQRLRRMRRRILRQEVRSPDLQVQHRIRILSKRLRYCIEALSPLLPQRRSKRWLRLATGLQRDLGATRDIASAVQITARLGVAPGIVEFLRGVAVGNASAQTATRIRTPKVPS